MTHFRICVVLNDGSIDLSPIAISPEVAAKRNLSAFMTLYEECRRVTEKYNPQKLKVKQLSLLEDTNDE